MTQLLENLILNPVEFSPDLPERDLSAGGLFIAQAPDFGESSQVVERVKQAVGEGVVSRHWPSVDCSVPLWVGADREVTKAAAYAPLEAFVGDLMRGKTRWVRRDFADVNGFAGSVGCPVDGGGLTTPLGYQPNEILLKLSRYPFWFATVETLAGEAEGTDVRDLQVELAELLGTAPGLIRVVVTNNGDEDWRGCSVAIECDDFSDAETAEPVYAAKDLTLQGGSEVTEDEAGDEVVKCPKLTKGWVTVLSSEIDGVGHMTHVGPRRMVFRLKDPSTETDVARVTAWEASGRTADGPEVDTSGVPRPEPKQVQWKLEWRALGSAAWIQTMEGSTPIVAVSPVAGDFQLLDLGEVRPERAISGDQRWECRVKACSPAGIELQPLIRDVYVEPTEQRLRVADTSDNAIDGEPLALGGTVENATGVGTVAWKAHSGSGTMSFAEESKYPTISSLSGTSNYLKVTNFGFGSLIPEGADIRGIIARAVPFEASGTIEEKRVRLVIGGTIKESEDKAGLGGGSDWYWSSPTTRSWGGVHDLWGQTSITRSQVAASNFGWALALSDNALEEVGETRKISFKRIEMIVAYSEGGNENRICFAGRAIEFSDNGVRRQHVTDDAWGDLVPEGFLLNSPSSGQAAKPLRALIVPSVGDFGTRADLAAVSPAAEIYMRAAYLFAREAS